MAGTKGARKRVRVQFPTDGADNLQYANGVLSTFTGTEFVITFYQVSPPPLTEPDELPDTVKARIVSRMAMTPEKWAEAVESVAKQLENLRVEGLIPPAQQPELEDEEG